MRLSVMEDADRTFNAANCMDVMGSVGLEMELVVAEVGPGLTFTSPARRSRNVKRKLVVRVGRRRPWRMKEDGGQMSEIGIWSRV